MPNLFKEVNGQMIFIEGGSLSESIKWKEDDYEIVGHRPTIGCSIKVGSLVARSYSDRDWWLTTEILEIIEETEDRVKFRTKNSIYIWKI
jgi:hypothetical protein